MDRPTLVKPVSAMSIDEMLEEAKRRDDRRRAGKPLAPDTLEVIKRAEELDQRLEKEVEQSGDKLMQAHGFVVVRFSQPRATKQTPGIPDRLYISPRRGVAVWWEAKNANGVQSPAQRGFQELVESAGWRYLLGTAGVLEGFLKDHGYFAE